MTTYNINLSDAINPADNLQISFNRGEDIIALLFKPYMTVFDIENVKTVDVYRYNNVAVIGKVSEEEKIIGWGNNERFITEKIIATVRTTADNEIPLFNSIKSALIKNSLRIYSARSLPVVWVKLKRYNKIEEVRGIAWLEYEFEILYYLSKW
ncbi:MAG: hypothetical protein QXU98_13890 [Candidatus Parvarchaeota archaeon]